MLLELLKTGQIGKLRAVCRSRGNVRLPLMCARVSRAF